MTENLFVHAGTHKTGTTYLQKQVFPRMDRGTYVLGTKRRAHRVIYELSKANPPVLWSQETLSGVRDLGVYRESQEQILRFVSSSFPGARLILFLREPSQIIRSFYIQHIHEGGTESFPEWFEGFKDAFYYGGMLDKLKDMKWGDVLLFDYAQLRNDPDYVVGAMERFVGCRFPDWKETRGKVANRSVAKNGARTLRYTNRFFRCKRNPDGSRFITKTAQIMRINPKYSLQEGSLRWLNKVGEPLIDEEALQDLKKQYSASWERTKARIEESQRRAGLNGTRPLSDVDRMVSTR